MPTFLSVIGGLEGISHLVRIHTRVGIMDHQDINIAGLEFGQIVV